MDVVRVFRSYPVGTVFTDPDPKQLPDSYVKISPTTFRRTYDWIEFGEWALKNFKRIKTTTPVPGSFDQEEADRRCTDEMNYRKAHPEQNGQGSW